VREQVRVAAQASVWVSWLEQGCLLTFSDHSVFAGRPLEIKRELAYQPVLTFTKSCVFFDNLAFWPLVAQKLR
jgi:hypothetical protein